MTGKLRFPQESQLFINVLEMKAVNNALLRLQITPKSHILVRSDNKTVVS